MPNCGSARILIAPESSPAYPLGEPGSEALRAHTE